jgi:hypothetical protein
MDHDAAELINRLSVERAELMAALKAKWQPIETAPKDGTEVLIYGLAWEDAQRGNYYAVAAFLDGAWRDSPEDVDDGWEMNSPTHWMPLPTPPEGEK